MFNSRSGSFLCDACGGGGEGCADGVPTIDSACVGVGARTVG